MKHQATLPGLYMSAPHTCHYLPERQAVNLFVDPDFPLDTGCYSGLARLGFRRSGQYIYRPHCPSCQACIPIRLPVSKFRPNRNQRRNLRRNAGLSFSERPAEYQEEHYRLYTRYLVQRHKDGGMDNPDPASYRAFLISSWCETRFHEIREGQRLLGVAVVDHLDDGLSAVYTFFDPDETHRSLGRYAVLMEIQLARSLGLDWLYLGYWVSGCRKMSYKNEYRPLQYFFEGRWQADIPWSRSGS